MMREANASLYADLLFLFFPTSTNQLSSQLNKGKGYGQDYQ
jgi:hypothetical protein